jgi:GH15 family glucan-1,4-alpha-glucosidase
MAPNDPRMVSTLQKINRYPEDGGLVANPMVYRYDDTKTDDGISDSHGRQGTFNMCTFWLIGALALMAYESGQQDELSEAQLKLEEMFTNANHLGLYSEEIGTNGKALGNFPHCNSHLSMIFAIYHLDMALRGKRRGW